MSELLFGLIALVILVVIKVGGIEVTPEMTRGIFVFVFGGMGLLILIDLISTNFYDGEPIPVFVSGVLQLFCIGVIIFVVVM